MQPVTTQTAVAAAIPPPQPSKPVVSPAKPIVPAEKESATSAKEVETAARQVEKFVQSISSDLQFTVDDTSGSFVVKVVDRATKEVIRQIPSEEMLAIAKALDRLQGLLVKQQA